MSAMADLLKDLERAMCRLRAGQIPHCRRKARMHVKKALRDVAEWLDYSYPAPPRKAPKKRKRRGPPANWLPVPDPLTFVAAGVRVRTWKNGNDRLVPYVPSWARDIARKNTPALRACVKDVKLRKALLVQIALGYTP